MIKACIFDLDGTLADTLVSIATATNKALEAVGCPPQPTDAYRYYAGDGARTLIRRALKAAGDTSCGKFDETYRVYCDIFEKDCTFKVTVFDGMTQVLEQMKAEGLRLAVLSNKPHERAKDVIRKLFGEGLFDVVQGQVDGLAKKPDPSGALKIMEGFGLTPETCMYIGDTNTDMKTGNSAGMYTVGVLWGFRDKKELLDNHAQALAQRPEDLLRLVREKNVSAVR